MIESAKIIRSKRRTLGLEIGPDAKLVIRAPLRASLAEIEKYVRLKQDWILKSRQYFLKKYKKPVVKKFVEGERFLFLGKSYSLKIVPEAILPLHLGKNFILNRACYYRARQLFTDWYKRQALTKFEEKTEFFAFSKNLRYRKISLSNSRTRWGQCSNQGDLSFSWRLIMAPEPIIEYIVVHEICHLREMNHSPRFWKQVAGVIPDYKKCRLWLNNNGYKLNI